MAARCCSFRFWCIFPNAEFHQNKSMITTLISFQTFPQTDHKLLSILFSIWDKIDFFCFQRGYSVILVYRPCAFCTIGGKGQELCLQARCYNWFLFSFKRILQEQKMMKLSIILIRNIKFTLLMQVSVNVNTVSLRNLITTETSIHWNILFFPLKKLIYHNLLFQDILILITILFYLYKTFSNCIFSFNVFLSHLDLKHC